MSNTVMGKRPTIRMELYASCMANSSERLCTHRWLTKTCISDRFDRDTVGVLRMPARLPGSSFELTGTIFSISRQP
jgi:hypothetical protein